MRSTATQPQDYIDELPEDRKNAMQKLRKTILENLPKGYSETMGYGMLSYVVPHSLYPEGYHCDPKTPLPFISIASQKNFIALYHMGIYSDPKLLEWFTIEYAKHSKSKLDMGKSCIRFKKIDQIPHELIAELVSKITPEDWIDTYTNVIKR
ncbi:DUF1801 domain-containing protein [Flavobacterium sp. '19STA2R22 D10 B1']|uniref:DUF1801 domain-containing protein n=1 Tax=Flavobacterium aerium TaxID=3037261 RepID=UPI00278C6C7D|nr:DUF1801 domain-containing protein [Flavobacterium sp. '19STA2R22 D10 B1']